MNMHAPKFLDTGRWGGLAYISEWQETMAGTLNVTDPANGNVLAAVGLCGPADIARARMLEKAYAEAEAKGLLARDLVRAWPTEKGFDFLSDLQALFLPD